jgi:DNA-binding MarR family transcriptional regulator
VTYYEQVTATRSNDPHPAPPPDGDPRWADLGDLALIIAREIQYRGYRDPEAVPLTQSEGVVMRYLQDHPGTPPSRLADATGLQRANISAVLRGLERKGLTERHASPDDLRRATIHPTERGRRNYALVRQEWAAVVSAAAGHDTAGLDEALVLLRTIATHLAASRPSDPGRPPGLM